MSHSWEWWRIRRIKTRLDFALTESQESFPYRMTCAWRMPQRPRSEVRRNNIPTRQGTRALVMAALARLVGQRPAQRAHPMLRAHPHKRRQGWLLISGHGGEQHEIEPHCGFCWRYAYSPAQYVLSNLPVKNCSLPTRDRPFPPSNLRA